jgi:cell division transport system permease protein
MAKTSIFSLALPPHDRRLIPDGRFSGAMPWVMAIMVFLAALASAGALVFANAAGQGGADLSREATVQILSTDPVKRSREQQAVAQFLKRYPGVTDVTVVSKEEARSLLEPWLGEAIDETSLPVPALIDVDFATAPSTTNLGKLRGELRSLSPGLRIEGNARWLQPFFDLMRTLLYLAGAVVLLLLLTTAATVALSVRGALNTHRSTIEIMHMMGATDMQAARLFQRRVALDALFGGAIGVVLAIVVIVLLGSRIEALAPALLGGASFPIYGWPVLAAIPLAVTGLAMLMARWTVLSALKRML